MTISYGRGGKMCYIAHLRWILGSRLVFDSANLNKFANWGDKTTATELLGRPEVA